MKKWSVETLSLAGVAAVLVLLVALAALAWHQVTLAGNASARVDLNYQRLAWIAQVQAHLRLAQAEQRHYEGAAWPAALARREAVLATLEQDLAHGEQPGVSCRNALPTVHRLHLLVSGLLPGQGTAAADVGVALTTGTELAAALVDIQRRQLAQVKREDSQRGRQMRLSLAFLLLVMAGLTCAILLQIRRLTRARQAAHGRLRQSETRYRQIVETSHEGIWLLDAQGRVSFANQRSADMVGYTVEELLGRPMHEFIDLPPGHIRCAVYQWPQEDLRQLTDLRFLRRGGEVGWAMVGSQTLRDEQGRFAGALVMVSDITARKHGEQALREAHDHLEQRIAQRTAELEDAVTRLRSEVAVRQAAEETQRRSERQLHEIVSMMPIALCIKDPDSRIIMMNQACEQMWGQPFAQLAGRRGSAHYPSEQLALFREHDRAAFASRRQIVNEVTLWHAGRGEHRQLQAHKKALYDADGQPQMLIAMTVDITERKRAEQALEQSLAQLRALSEHQRTSKEEEHRRIALDIHDELGQNLMALKIDVAMLHARTAQRHPRLHQRAGHMLVTLDATIVSVRSIINDLYPSALALGLCAAIEWLLRQSERRGGPRCRLELIDDSAERLLDTRQTAALFRIVQEALDYIARYAAASTVRLALDLGPQRMSIVIEDDGNPAPASEQTRAAAFAMKGIKERVAALGGELMIARRLGGTTLSLLLPGVAPADVSAPAPTVLDAAPSAT